MPLTNVQIQPGFNKQVTAVGAEGQWTDGDFVRFRYGLPEKIGGWEQLTSNTLVGAARDQLVWADLDGRRYSAIGTSKALIVYFEGSFYDVSPLDTAITGATFTTANTSPTVTVNKIAHGFSDGDLFKTGSYNQKATEIFRSYGVNKSLREVWPVLKLKDTILWIPGIRKSNEGNWLETQKDKFIISASTEKVSIENF